MDHCFVFLQCFEIVGCMTGRTSGGKTPTPLGYWTTCGYANSRIANSRTGRLADWTSSGLVKSRTGQLADVIGDFACLVSFLVASARPRVVQSASCPVRELTSVRVVYSARCPVRELSSPRVVQSAS